MPIPNIGPGELILILIIALVILGPGKLPDVAASLGKSVREFRKAATDVTDAGKLDPPATPPPAATPTTTAATPAAPVVPPAPAASSEAVEPVEPKAPPAEAPVSVGAPSGEQTRDPNQP